MVIAQNPTVLPRDDSARQEHLSPRCDTRTRSAFSPPGSIPLFLSWSLKVLICVLLGLVQIQGRKSQLGLDCLQPGHENGQGS